MNGLIKVCALVTFLISILLTGCLGNKQSDELVTKPKDAPFYTPEEHEIKNWLVDEIWEEKLKTLSETDIPEFESIENISKDYVLNLARYQQTMSPDGFQYDEQRQVYVIIESDVKYYAKSCLGIEEFDYPESSEYNKELKTFECAEYPQFGLISRVYSNKKLMKLPENQWDFSIDIAMDKASDQEKKLQEAKTPIRERYIIADDEKGFRVLSVSRSAVLEQESGESDEVSKQ